LREEVLVEDVLAGAFLAGAFLAEVVPETLLLGTAFAETLLDELVAGISGTQVQGIIMIVDVFKSWG
jgi:hypothetical protein